MIRSLAVFCGSKSGTDTLIATHAQQLGHLLAEHGVKMIYGGSSSGIMGIVADAALAGNGKVTGILPQVLIAWERQHHGITELIIADDMHERKKKLYELCDAALVLPGGFGTLDELFEMLTWNQLSIHDKPIFILNTGGFFNQLLAHIDHLEKTGFLYETAKDRITILNGPGELVDFLI